MIALLIILYLMVGTYLTYPGTPLIDQAMIATLWPVIIALGLLVLLFFPEQPGDM